MSRKWQRASIRDRLLRSFTRDPATECWNSAYACGKNGYARVGKNGRSYDAHRIAYIEFVGPIPAGLLVCHRCDNKRCINPDHLFVGTDLDNAQDCMLKGRRPKRIPPRKLSDEAVIQIKSLWPERSQYEIARMFCVSQGHVKDILKGKKRKYG